MSEAAYQPTGQFLAEQQPLVDAIGASAAEIQALNEQGVQFDDKAFEDWRPVGDDYCSEEQAEAFTRMLAASTQIQYDELLQRTEHTSRWRERLADERTALEQAYAAEADNIREAAAYHIKLLPGAIDRFVEESDRRIARIDRRPLEQLGYQEQAAERVAAKLGNTLRIAGCLPIPAYVPPEQRMAIYESFKTPSEIVTSEEQAPETIEVDHFPVDPSTLTKAQLVERVQRRVPEERRRDASAFLALILAEDPGRAYTYKDLGQMLYPNENSKKAAKRVTALISNMRSGETKIIPETLVEQHMPPLVLQVGERVRYFKSTGIRVGQTKLVFRAVASPDEPARPVYEDGTTDINWRSLEAPTVPGEPYEQPKSV